jgi:pyruvate formate lyase activating enzyme
MQNEPLRGLLTNVQRFSIHDGPGIRTTAFMKGCPLRCFWCHNPETLSPRPEIQFFPERCIGCLACAERCEHGGHIVESGQHLFRREFCIACGACADSCYAEALVLAGQWWTPEALLAELLRDRAFYDSSDGGITLSGGEPLLQQPFSLAVLQLCKEAGLHTAIETALLSPWNRIAELLPWLDLVMMDLKLMDEAAHRAATGVSNRLILENMRRLAACGLPLIVRTPVVPTVNDTVEAIGAIAEFVAGLDHVLYYELMPFHRMASGKYRSLGQAYRAGDLQAPQKETLDALAAAARSRGLAEVKVA